jgi:hypothetical protein
MTGLKLAFIDKLITDDKKVVDQLVLKVFGSQSK